MYSNLKQSLMSMKNAENNINARNVTPTYIRLKKSAKRKVSVQSGGSSGQQSNRSSNQKGFEVYQKRIYLQRKSHERKKSKGISLTPSSHYDQYKEQKRSNSNETYHQVRQKHELKLKESLLPLRISSFIGIKQSIKNNSIPKIENNSPSKADYYAQQTTANLQKNIREGAFIGNYLHKLKGNSKKTANKSKPMNHNKKYLNIDMKMQPQQQLRKYKILGELGKGAHASVKMATDSMNNRFAIKIYEKKTLTQANKLINLQRQINILSKLSHPNIAKILKIIDTKNQLYLIMQYGGGNSLFSYLISKQEHRLPREQINIFLLTIANILQYLHSKNIIHRDIKAENILINKHKQLKLIDFGFSIYSQPGQQIDTFCGTPVYMAPEIVSRMNHIPIYTDLWSFGILIYVVTQGNYPFRAKKQEELFSKIYSGVFGYIKSDISIQHKYLIENLLVRDPNKRLTIDKVMEILKKPSTY